MKHTTLKYLGLATMAALAFSSCTTTYDAYGRPVETIDPAAAAVGAVAIGALAYAIGSDHSDYYDRHHGHQFHQGYASLLPSHRNALDSENANSLLVVKHSSLPYRSVSSWRNQ